MFAQGLHHIGHAASAVSTVLHLPERGRTVAPTLLTLAGFTPVQVELLIGGFLVTIQGVDIALRRIKSHLPNGLAGRHSSNQGSTSLH
jgi:hypothetical protein